jgi:allophanate hydrolase
LKARLAPVLASVDLICVPTAPTHYTVEQVLADPIATNSRLGTYTNFVNLLDLCGIAVPAGRRADGLPMSVTLLAAAGKESLIAGLARDIQAEAGTTLGATLWQLDWSGAGAPANPEDDGIELAVVGAHLSGMPLNGHLKELGAEFCRATRTAPAYRLYALAGRAVPKPGLIRATNGDGASIDVEVWRLGAAAFGRFVAAVQPPLSIGTIELEGGGRCKGFLVEPAGLDGATDISQYGGWRAFCERDPASCS